MILVATTVATTTSAPNTTLYNAAVETIGDMMDSFSGFEPLALRLCTDEDKRICIWTLFKGHLSKYPLLSS